MDEIFAQAVESLDLFGFEGDDAAASEMLADVWLTLELQGVDYTNLQAAD